MKKSLVCKILGHNYYWYKTNFKNKKPKDLWKCKRCNSITDNFGKVLDEGFKLF